MGGGRGKDAEQTVGDLNSLRFPADSVRTLHFEHNATVLRRRQTEREQSDGAAGAGARFGRSGQDADCVPGLSAALCGETNRAAGCAAVRRPAFLKVRKRENGLTVV